MTIGSDRRAVTFDVEYFAHELAPGETETGMDSTEKPERVLRESGPFNYR